MTLRYDVRMYEQVFQILKNKIECGLLPTGASLPSRMDLCREFKTSEKTIRHALKMLEEQGLIETHQRKRPIVSCRRDTGHQQTMCALEKIRTTVADDALKAGALLCYPLIINGISCCKQEDLKIPRKILESISVADSSGFWKSSTRFWRFFVARNENDLSLRAADSLGLADFIPNHDGRESRARYYEQLLTFVKIIESGGTPGTAHFDDMSGFYRLTSENQPSFHTSSNSAAALGNIQMEKLLTGAEMRYSAVYMDILGLIVVGRYRLGNQLPPYKELQKIYNVSVDTTAKAIQILQEWGVVKTVRGSGIFIEMDLNGLKQIQIPVHLIACHVRRYLDSLNLLALTIEGTALCAAAHITQAEIEKAKDKMTRLWDEEYLYERTPAILLDCITEHIGIDALNTIYQLLQRNLRIGRSIPALLDTKKTAISCDIHEQCVMAIEQLSIGNHKAFSEKTAHLFQNIYRLVIDGCKQLEYYEAAMGVYNGSALWK